MHHMFQLVYSLCWFYAESCAVRNLRMHNLKDGPLKLATVRGHHLERLVKVKFQEVSHCGRMPCAHRFAHGALTIIVLLEELTL